MVHSSLSRVGPVTGGAGAVIDTLLALIGPKGTLMMPTHTWSTVNARQPVFHAVRTPSIVGYLTEAFRKRSGAIRSLHPCHSVAAVGPRAEFFTAGQLAVDTPCPPESPYGRIMRDPASAILFLGTDLNCNTCYHALEEEAGYPALLTADREDLVVIDGCGVQHPSPQHRHAEIFQRFYSDTEYMLLEAGVLKAKPVGSAVSRLVRAAPMRDMILEVLRTRPELIIRPERRG
jgi:aminoglycoside 3-N-acetyltransferase